MNAKQQIIKATELGILAFHNGKKCVPGWDAELMSMLAGRQIGEVPVGETSSVKIMGAWQKSWTIANLAN